MIVSPLDAEALLGRYDRLRVDDLRRRLRNAADDLVFEAKRPICPSGIALANKLLAEVFDVLDAIAIIHDRPW